MIHQSTLAFARALAITESVPWNEAVRIGTTWWAPGCDVQLAIGTWQDMRIIQVTPRLANIWRSAGSLAVMAFFAKAFSRSCQVDDQNTLRSLSCVYAELPKQDMEVDTWQSYALYVLFQSKRWSACLGQWMDDATCWMNIGLLQYRSVLWYIIAAYWSFDIVRELVYVVIIRFWFSLYWNYLYLMPFHGMPLDKNNVTGAQSASMTVFTAEEQIDSTSMNWRLEKIYENDWKRHVGSLFMLISLRERLGSWSWLPALQLWFSNTRPAMSRYTHCVTVSS